MWRSLLAVALASCAAAPTESAPPPTPAPEPHAVEIDAAANASTSSDAAPVAVIDAAAAPSTPPGCLPKLLAELAHRRPGALSPPQNVRARLAAFGAACAEDFPDWAAAAKRASKLGRRARRRVFAEVATACPAVADASSAKDVVDRCPDFVGHVWDGAAENFLKLADPGTFALCTFMERHGFDTLAAELALQTTFHPEWDP